MPLKKQMLTVEELSRVDDMEGLGWFLDEYHPEQIEDRRLRELWQAARDAMTDVRAFIEDWMEKN